MSPLSLAAAQGSSEAVELLLAHRASVSVQNEEGLTPIMIASQARHVEVALRLVEHIPQQ